jgi:hypothetical protein
MARRVIDDHTDEDNVSLTVVPVPNVGPGLPGLLAVKPPTRSSAVSRVSSQGASGAPRQARRYAFHHLPAHWLGHKNIQHTVRYTELAPDRFKDFWR